METGLWGSNDIIHYHEPLSDRVEMAVVKFLIEHPNCTFEEILRDAATHLPGLLTPSLGLVGEVLVSYAEQAEGRWVLRAEDQPSKRKAELIQMADLLHSIGARLDFYTNRLDERTLVWEVGETSEYVIHLKASAVLGQAVVESPYPRERSLVVLPAGRASLLAYKSGRDPALAERLKGFRFIKFRLVRALAGIPVLNLKTFETRIASDPIETTRNR